MDDLTSELDLRKVEPPWEAIRDETERVAQRIRAMMIQKHTPECAPVSGNFSMISKAHEIEVLAALRPSLPVSLQRAGKRVLVLTQKAVLYVCVDSMQPLLGALGFLLISGGLRL